MSITYNDKSMIVKIEVDEPEMVLQGLLDFVDLANRARALEFAEQVEDDEVMDIDAWLNWWYNQPVKKKLEDILEYFLYSEGWQ